MSISSLDAAGKANHSRLFVLWSDSVSLVVGFLNLAEVVNLGSISAIPSGPVFVCILKDV